MQSIVNTHANDIVLSLRMLGVPEVVSKPLVLKLLHNVACEGAETVVKRVKTLKQAAVSVLAGKEPNLPWIRHKGGTPSGVWRPVWKWLLSMDHRKRMRAFNTLMVYTSFRVSQDSEPTKTQLLKFMGSVCQPPEVVASRETVFKLVPTLSFFKRAEEVLSMYVRDSGVDIAAVSQPPNILEYLAARFGSGKDLFERDALGMLNKAKEFLANADNDVWLGFAPYLKVMAPLLSEEAHNRKKRWERKLFFTEMEWRATHEMDRMLRDPERYFLKMWEEVKDHKDDKSINLLSTEKNRLGFFEASLLHPALPQPPTPEGRVHPTVPVGNLFGSQEPGMKLRAFASPVLPLQAALEGLKSKMMDVIKRLPWDCCFDQEKGVARVQGWIQAGRKVFSVDLTDATNNAPLVMQEELLLRLGFPRDEVFLFSSVASALWNNPWSGKVHGLDYPAVVRWTQGQPLGTGPSFAIFSLFHAWLALSAMAKAKKPQNLCEDTFVILGDDIVIADADVHIAYREILAMLMLPVSQGKCLENASVAEFAGAVISSKEIIRGFKFKKLETDNFVSIIDAIGARVLSRSFLTKRQFRLAVLLRDIPKPWGFGYNSKGLPHEKQEQLAQLLVMWHYVKDLVTSSKPLDSSAHAVDKLLYEYGVTMKGRSPRWYRRIHPMMGEPYSESEKNSPRRFDKVKPFSALTELEHDPRGVMLWVLHQKELPIVQRGRPDADVLGNRITSIKENLLVHVKSLLNGRSLALIAADLLNDVSPGG